MSTNKKTLDVLSVIEMLDTSDPTNICLTTFSRENVADAEDLFIKTIEEHNVGKLNNDDKKFHLDDGYFIDGTYQVSLVWSIDRYI